MMIFNSGFGTARACVFVWLVDRFGIPHLKANVLPDPSTGVSEVALTHSDCCPERS